MNTKQVSQLDAEGYFVGVVLAEESPLEQGVFLIPGGAIDRAPPKTIEAGKRYKPYGSAWRGEDLPQPEPTPEPPAPDPIELCKAEAKARLIETDWAMLPDVRIGNRAEFEVYRAAVRALYVTPQAAPAWPEKPGALWL